MLSTCLQPLVDYKNTLSCNGDTHMFTERSVIPRVTPASFPVSSPASFPFLSCFLFVPLSVSFPRQGWMFIIAECTPTSVKPFPKSTCILLFLPNHHSLYHVEHLSDLTQYVLLWQWK